MTTTTKSISFSKTTVDGSLGIDFLFHHAELEQYLRLEAPNLLSYIENNSSIGYIRLSVDIGDDRLWFIVQSDGKKKTICAFICPLNSDEALNKSFDLTMQYIEGGLTGKKYQVVHENVNTHSDEE